MSMHTRHNEIQERIARPCFDGTRNSARQRQYVPRIFSLHFAAMMRLMALILFSGGLRADLAPAQSMDPVPLLPANFRWLSPPGNPALQVAWVIGSEQKPGPYILRVKLADEGRIPPHTHPDERSSTVLAGALYVGFGEDFDESKVVAIPAGAVYVTPANTPHYVWAKEGDVIYQEAGAGPTKTSFAKPR